MDYFDDCISFKYTPEAKGKVKRFLFQLIDLRVH